MNTKVQIGKLTLLGYESGQARATLHAEDDVKIRTKYYPAKPDENPPSEEFYTVQIEDGDVSISAFLSQSAVEKLCRATSDILADAYDQNKKYEAKA